MASLCCEQFQVIVIHTPDVINDPSFMNIEVNTLMDILNQDELSIESEDDLFNVLVSFADKRCERKASTIGDVRAIETTNCKESEGEKEPPEKKGKPNQEITDIYPTGDIPQMQMELRVFNGLFDEEKDSAVNRSGMYEHWTGQLVVH